MSGLDFPASGDYSSASGWALPVGPSPEDAIVAGLLWGAGGEALCGPGLRPWGPQAFSGGPGPFLWVPGSSQASGSRFWVLVPGPGSWAFPLGPELFHAFSMGPKPQAPSPSQRQSCVPAPICGCLPEQLPLPGYLSWACYSDLIFGPSPVLGAWVGPDLSGSVSFYRRFPGN